MSTPSAHAEPDRSAHGPEFDDLLTPDALSALMRSTWTWDDRALRRDLSTLLVELDAARAAGTRADDSSRREVLRARAHSSAARFVAAVLGPKLIADTGNPLRAEFLTDAIDPARFDRTASAALRHVQASASEYIDEHTRQLEYPAETSWMGLVAADGAQGLGAAMRACGNTLSSSAFYGSMGLVWQTLRAVTGESTAAAEYADKLQSGAISATLAAAEQSGSWDPAMVRTRAVEDPQGWQLTGLKQFVPAADGADVYFVIGRSTAGPSLFAVESSVPGLKLTPLDGIDKTRPLHQVELSDTPAVLLGAEGAGGRLMTRAIDLATTALAGEQVGLIEKSMTVLAATGVDGAAASTESRLAEVTLGHIAAASLWRQALSEDAAGSQGASAAAAAAHIACSAAAVRSATAVAELVGPSDETDALLRRALSASLLFGGPALSHERHLERLGV